ncbi:prepilin peptidase [Bacillus timonensis]|nr:prepilin peptidase [Bacillus timonensis]
MIFDSLLLLILLICVITDLRERKIYNKIIFPSLLISLLLHCIFDGFNGLFFSLAGFGAGFGILLIPYLLGGMGAGDVKLLALIGTLKGALFVSVTAIYMALFGGLIALGILLFRKGILQRFKSMLYTFYGIRYGLKIPLSLAIDKEAMTSTYPYGVAIAGGAIVSLFAKGLIIS